MKNKKLSLILFFSFALALTGCNKEESVQGEEQVSVVETPEEIDETGFGITLDEQKMCAEYAAGVLMKYNAGSNMRVLEGKKLEKMEIQEQVKKEQEEKREQLAAEYQANKPESSNEVNDKDKNSESSSSNTSAISYIDDMSVATGTDSFSIHYEGYEITDSYSGDEEDSFFAIDAVQGKVLLVTRFNVTNKSGQVENFNMYSNQGKYKLYLDGVSYKAQHTLLLNDLAMYKGDIEAGETVETVLVFEIPEEKASFVGKMELNITIGDMGNTMLLQGGSGAVNISENENNENASDLAEEYEAALQAEENALGDSDLEDDSEGNVTVVGSNNSISQE